MDRAQKIIIATDILYKAVLVGLCVGVVVLSHPTVRMWVSMQYQRLVWEIKHAEWERRHALNTPTPEWVQQAMTETELPAEES